MRVDLAPALDSNPWITKAEAGWNNLTQHSGVLSHLLIAILILIATLFLAKWISNIVKRAAKRYSQTDADRTLPEFLSQVVWWFILIIGLVAILNRLGVETTSILTVLGAASLAVGLALQGTLSNVAAGIMLLIQKPYRIGDIVTLGEATGTIHRLGLFSTEITNGDHHRVYIPNAKIFAERIVNISHYDIRKIEILITVSSDTDIESTLKMMRELAKNHPSIVATPEVWAGIDSFKETGISLKLWAHTEIGAFLQTRADLFLSLKLAFDKNKLSLNFNPLPK
jgi:small conductance mechanosensitive channel